MKDKADEEFEKPSNVVAMDIDALAGGLPHGGQTTRSEFFIKGTEPTSESPIYKAKDGKNYLVLYENDPVSRDGVNRWQKGIEEWIEDAHKGDEMYHPPGELFNDIRGAQATPTQTPSPTP